MCSASTRACNGATEIARTDIARPDNVTPDQTEVTIFMLHGISGLYELHLSVCTSLLRHLGVLLYTVLVFYDVFLPKQNN